MHVMKPVLKNLTVLNGFLSAVIALWIFLLVVPFVNMDIKITAARANKLALGTKTASTESTTPALVDYTLISELNLFHPDRKIPPEKADEKAVPRPEIVLYGTLLTNDVSIAYIEDKKSPRTSPGRGKRQIAVEKGYNLNGYILKEIKPDNIVFVKGDERLLVRLEDGDKRRDAETVKSPMISGSAAAGAQPPAQATVKAVPQQETMQPAATGQQAGTNPAIFGTTGRRNAAQIQVQMRRQAAQQMQQQQTQQ